MADRYSVAGWLFMEILMESYFYGGSLQSKTVSI